MAGTVGGVSTVRGGTFTLDKRRQASSAGLFRECPSVGPFGRAEGNDCRGGYWRRRIYSDPGRRPTDRQVHGILRYAAPLLEPGDRRRADAWAATWFQHCAPESGARTARGREECTAVGIHRRVFG